MKINILLPHKEKFDKYKASSVSITVKNNLLHSKYKKNIMVFGQKTDNPIMEKNFTGIENPGFILKSKNKNLAEKMCDIILSEKDKNQIIEIHNRPYLLNYIYKRLKKFPICLFFHNDPQKMLGSKKIRERKKLLKQAKAIYCVSNYIRSKFIQGLDNNTEKVKVIYNGVERIFKKRSIKRKEIIFTGRLVPEKGVHLYVKAISKIFHKFPDWKFRLIGSSYLGSLSKETRYAVNVRNEFLKIGKQAIFEGFIDSDAVQKRMKDASIIVIPSTWEEPFGLVVAEAMSNGAAIITSNVGGIPEIIKNNGIVIDDINEDKIEDALLYLITTPKKLQQMQKSSWDNFTHTANSSSKLLDCLRSNIFN